MEINLKELDFQIAINSCYDQIMFKMEMLTNMEIQLLRKFQHQVGNSQSHFKMIRDIRTVMANLQQMFKDVKDYFTQMNAAFIYDFFRKMHVLMISGYNFLSQALLTNYDKIQAIASEGKNSDILSCKKCKCTCSDSKQNEKRKQNKEIQQFDYKINVLQNQENKLKEQIQVIYDKMMLQKTLIQKTKPSLAVRQLQDMKEHIQNVMESTNSIFQQTYMLKYVEFKNYMTQIKKPEDLITHFISNMNFSMKNKFISSMTKALFKMQNLQKSILIIPGKDVEIQTDEIIHQQMKETTTIRPFLLKPDKNQNLLTKQRKNNQKVVVQLQFSKKQINQLNKDLQKVKETLKSLQKENLKVKQDYETLLSLYTQKNKQLQVLKQENSWLKQHEYKKLKSQISQLKRSNNAEKKDQEVQVLIPYQWTSAYTQTQTHMFQNPVDNQVIKLLKNNNQKMIVKLNEKQKKIRQLNRNLKSLQNVDKMKSKFCQIIKQLGKLYSLSYLITPEITNKNDPLYIDQEEYILNKTGKFIIALKQMTKISNSRGNIQSSDKTTSNIECSQNGIEAKLQLNKKRQEKNYLFYSNQASSHVLFDRSVIQNRYDKQNKLRLNSSSSFNNSNSKSSQQVKQKRGSVNSHKSNSNQIKQNRGNIQAGNYLNININGDNKKKLKKKEVVGIRKASITNNLDQNTSKNIKIDSLQGKNENLTLDDSIQQINIKKNKFQFQFKNIQVQTQQTYFNQSNNIDVDRISFSKNSKNQKQLIKRSMLGKKLYTQNIHEYSLNKNYVSVNNTIALSGDQISEIVRQSQNGINPPRNSTQSKLSCFINNQFSSRTSRFSKPIAFKPNGVKRQSQIQFDSLKISEVEQNKPKQPKYSARQYEKYYKVKNQSKFKTQQRDSHQSYIHDLKNIQVIDQMNQSMGEETLIEVKKKNPVERPQRQSPSKQFLKLAKLLLLSQTKQNLISLIENVSISRGTPLHKQQKSKVVIKVSKKGYSPRSSTKPKLDSSKNQKNMKIWDLF